MTTRLFPIIALTALSACATTATRDAAPAATVTEAPRALVGMARVTGQGADRLTALFGAPDLDVREEGVQRLQFRGPICILDAYLYADRTNGRATVRHVDARQPDGRAIDRGSCVEALVARRAGN